MSDLIDGFKLHIPTEDLARMLKGRVKYHLERAQQKEKELPELEAILKRTQPTKAQERAAKFSNYTTNVYHDPVTSLKQEIRAHKVKAARFDFYSRHLAAGVYVLESRTAMELELVDDEDDDDR